MYPIILIRYTLSIDYLWNSSRLKIEWKYFWIPLTFVSICPNLVRCLAGEGEKSENSDADKCIPGACVQLLAPQLRLERHLGVHKLFLNMWVSRHNASVSLVSTKPPATQPCKNLLTQHFFLDGCTHLSFSNLSCGWGKWMTVRAPRAPGAGIRFLSDLLQWKPWPELAWCDTISTQRCWETLRQTHFIIGEIIFTNSSQSEPPTFSRGHQSALWVHWWVLHWLCLCCSVINAFIPDRTLW